MLESVRRRARRAIGGPGLLALIVAILGAGLAGAQGGAPAQSSSLHLPLIAAGRAITQPEGISFWGMNAYLSKRERIAAGDNRAELARLAREAGVAWTREELPWDLIEPSDDDFRGVYDADLLLAAERGLGIIGMLLTTPAWARDGACPGDYWCPPANVGEFAEFAAWMVERYDGDGRDDAPGSPRIAYWQIWNEPNDTALWPNIGGGADARKLRYGQLLVAVYGAIKAADPTATVLSGGVYIYDGSCAGGVCDGLNFFNADGGVFRQLPAARRAFDVFAIHPYIPDRRPDDPAIPRIITVEGRIRTTRAWLNDPAIGRPDAPLWISEIGWCTAPGACPGGAQISEAQQASYLARSLVIAQQNGVQHASWFQLEDAFDNPNRTWGNAAILRQFDGASYPLKPAYVAYRALATTLAGATPVGTGPLHTHSYDSANPYVGSGGTYNYRYTRGATVIDVLWRPNDTLQVSFPVATDAGVTLYSIHGTAVPLKPSGGAVGLTLSEAPLLIVQSR